MYNKCYLFVNHAALDPFIFIACFQWNWIHTHFTAIVTSAQPIFFNTFQSWITPWEEVSGNSMKIPKNHKLTNRKKLKCRFSFKIITLCHLEHVHEWHDWRTMLARVVLKFDHLEIEPRIDQAPSWSIQLLKFSAFFHVLFVK